MSKEIVWIELVKVIPSVVTAFTAVFGVWIAKTSFDKWRIETIGKRKIELAEHVLIDARMVREVLRFARIGSQFIGEGKGEARIEGANESESVRKRRNRYFVPIERLLREKELFARFQSERYAFAVYCGDDAAKPFDTFDEVRREIMMAASQLIESSEQEDSIPADESSLAVLGWRPGRPDEIDKKIDTAMASIEKTCRPILSAIALQ